MVIDKIDNYKLYEGLGDKITKAFEYIRETDFSKMNAGKYEIDSQEMFVIVEEYEAKDKSERKLEGHRKYMDVQYMVSGTELIGVAPLTNQIQISNNEEGDIAFYEGDASFMKLDKGMFALFFPDDLHMPCIRYEEGIQVKKAVVKVRI